MRPARDPWLDVLGKPRTCANCDSRLLTIPLWWPVDDQAAIYAADYQRLLERLRFKES